MGEGVDVLTNKINKKLRILALTYSYGGDASGIVVRNIINELSNSNQVEVWAYKIDSQISQNEIENIRLLKYPIDISYIDYIKVSMRLFRDDILCDFSKYGMRTGHMAYDIVVSFVYGFYYQGLIIGSYIKRKLSVPHYCYMIDPIPTPIGWTRNNFFRKQVSKFIKSYSKFVDVFAVSNPRIIDYEKLFIPNNRFEVVYTPISDVKFNDTCNINKLGFNFLYAGSIYGARTPYYFLKAFERLIGEGVDASITFLGTTGISEWLNFLSYDCCQKIFIESSTNDLSKYYIESDALVDIDADLANDIFVSSKLINYLCVNRPILCETNVNSPSHDLLNGLESVIFSDHNVDNMYQCMRNLILADREYNYTERKEIIDYLNVKSVVERMFESFQILVCEGGRNA